MCCYVLSQEPVPFAHVLHLAVVMSPHTCQARDKFVIHLNSDHLVIRILCRQYFASRDLTLS